MNRFVCCVFALNVVISQRVIARESPHIVLVVADDLVSVVNKFLTYFQL